MDNIITDIINKIDKKITYYESQNVDYKKYERIILDKFLPFDEFLNSNDDEKFINLYFCKKYNIFSNFILVIVLRTTNISKMEIWISNLRTLLE